MSTERKPVETKITREALIVKMVEHRMGNWDSGDTRDAILEGRNGFYEMTNEELEEIALDSYELCDDEGNVVAYKITDPCPIGATPEEISAELLKALKAVVSLCDDGDADMLTRRAARIAKKAIAKAKGR